MVACQEVIKWVKPIYLDLIKPNEHKRCIHGITQTQNDSFNSTIWEQVPKVNYCLFDKLEFAVYDAVANFNDGTHGPIDVLQKLNICAGYHTTTMCFEFNKRPKYLAIFKSKDSTKKTRKIIRATGAEI